MILLLLFFVKTKTGIKTSFWSAEVFASARASAETDALQDLFYNVLLDK